MQIRDLEEKTDLGVLAVLRRACSLRMRPVLMTAARGLARIRPDDPVHELGRRGPAAPPTVVIGGLVASTLLTLFVLPTRYSFFRRPRAVAASS